MRGQRAASTRLGRERDERRGGRDAAAGGLVRRQPAERVLRLVHVRLVDTVAAAVFLLGDDAVLRTQQREDASVLEVVPARRYGHVIVTGNPAASWAMTSASRISMLRLALTSQQPT